MCVQEYECVWEVAVCFKAPFVPTAVTRAKQGRAEIDDTGLRPSLIRDSGFVLDVPPRFISTGTELSPWFTSCLLTGDLRPSRTGA